MNRTDKSSSSSEEQEPVYGEEGDTDCISITTHHATIARVLGEIINNHPEWWKEQPTNGT
jgi:hypothetical protein